MGLKRELISPFLIFQDFFTLNWTIKLRMLKKGITIKKKTIERKIMRLSLVILNCVWQG